MRIAYLECFAGISGDMFLGALVDAGVDPKLLHDAVAALNIGATLEIEKVDRSGINASKIRVLVDGASAEAAANSTHTHQHSHHEHHHHGRSLSVIRQLIQHAPLADAAKATAIRAFELLGESEAKIHNVPIESIHFHEVGAVDSIVDIVAGSVGAHALAADSWICSPLNVGGGTVECAHGTFPVPAPATMDLLQGVPTYSSGIQMELVTPTGAALVRALNCTFGPAPAMRVDKIGYGAGSRNPKRFPNVVRLSLGDRPKPPLNCRRHGRCDGNRSGRSEPPNPWRFHRSCLAGWSAGRDVLVRAHEEKQAGHADYNFVRSRPRRAIAATPLFRETSTLGVRIREERRACLDRKFVNVKTQWGEIKIKIGLLNGVEVNAAPEYEDCRRCAEKHAVPLKLVMQSALAIYQTTPRE